MIQKWNSVEMETFLLKFYIFLQILLCVQCTCIFGGTTSCIENYGDACNFTFNNTKVQYRPKIGHERNAEYDVEFISFMNSCGFDSYDVNLELIPNVTSESGCVYDYSMSNEKSVQTFKIINADPSCLQAKLEFCIKYWFSGCYMLTVRPRLGSNSHKPVAHYIWMVNGYSLEAFTFGRPIFQHSNFEPLEATWQFGPKTFTNNDTKITIRLSHLDKIDEQNFISNDATENCTWNDQKVVCKFNNLTEGNYSAHLTLDDEWRCQSQDLIFGPCDWSSDFVRYKATYSSGFKFESNAASKYLDWIIISSLIVLFLCIVISVYCYNIRKQRSFSDPPLEVYCKKDPKHNLKGIFLLYARDCQPFMETMVELRRYFVSQTRCRVYDIFDPTLFNEIATSPHEFVESLLQDPQINVVIIGTECFEHLYQSLLHYFSKESNYGKEVSHLSQLYRVPNWLDGLIIHALKLISYDTSAASYKKFFVMRLPKFNNLGNYLMHINPCTRFDLPAGLDILVEKISFGSQENGILHSIENRENLHKALFNLNNYVTYNSKYLTNDILNIEIFKNYN